MKILIVDDSRFLRQMSERALVKAGHEVVAAVDGEEGLRLAGVHKPDLIVLDMMLPKLPGQDVLRALRKDLGTAAIPVLMLDKGPGAFVEAVEKMLNRAKKARAAGR
jgi:DNA-binding response OmpR family regulator